MWSDNTFFNWKVFIEASKEREQALPLNPFPKERDYRLFSTWYASMTYDSRALVWYKLAALDALKGKRIWIESLLDYRSLVWLLSPLSTIIAHEIMWGRERGKWVAVLVPTICFPQMSHQPSVWQPCQILLNCQQQPVASAVDLSKHQPFSFI